MSAPWAIPRTTEKLCEDLTGSVEDPRLLERIHKAAALGIQRLNAEKGLREGTVTRDVYEKSRKFYPYLRSAKDVLNGR